MRDPGGKYVKEENEVSSVRRTQRSLGIQERNSELCVDSAVRTSLLVLVEALSDVCWSDRGGLRS